MIVMTGADNEDKIYKPCPALKRLAEIKTKYTPEKEGKKCPLCGLDLSKEKVFYDSTPFMVIRTKDLKGHRERIVIVLTEHRHEIPFKTYEIALDILTEIGKRVFKYVPKFVIMDSTFATINEHWHLVATDLDPKTEDFDQILATKWIKVIDSNWD